MSKGMTTCKVCGRDFALVIEDHYVGINSKKMGAFAALVDNTTATEYDLFDCPHCGCQNVMQERKPPFNLVEESDDRCIGCKYIDTPVDKDPCCRCKHNFEDMYVMEEKENGR